jgi:predicted metal-dependent HD superfamily phosphohydrolase
MGNPDFTGAINFAISRLEKELSAEFLYHTCAHTRDDVLVAVRKFAGLSPISEEEMHLVEVAAAFHDLGFIYQINGHEQRGAEVAGEELPRFGLSAQQIELIYNMIMATRLPQNPKNLLEELLADADLDVLGRDDFLVRNDLLRQETARLGKAFTDEQWYGSQLKFLESHHYFSEAARSVRSEGKKINISLLKHKLKNIEFTQSGGG